MTIYVNFFIHSEDIISAESQHATRHLAELFARHGLKADFYLTGLVAERMLAEAPATIATLKRLRMPISYHADIHAPFPTPQERVRDLDWDAAVAQIRIQETHHLDPLTGALSEGRPNQMALLTELFGRPPLVTVGAPAGQGAQAIRYAQHRMGVPMASSNGAMLGLPLVWHNGMLRGEAGEGSYFYVPEMYFTPWQGEPLSAAQLAALLDVQIEQIPRGRDSLLSFGVHDHFFALTDGWLGCYIDPQTRRQGNPPRLWASPPLPATERERLWHLYESVVAYCARRADLTIITAEDVLSWVEPLPQEQVLSRAEVVAVAEAVLLGWAGPGYPPAHVEADGRHLSLADAFQALVHALAWYRRYGTLPDQVVIRELLGPTDTPLAVAIGKAEFRPRCLLDGEQVADLAAAIAARMSDRIPGVVDLTGRARPLPSLLAAGLHPQQVDGLLNPAEFLHLTAQVVQTLARSGQPGQALLAVANLFPQPPALRWAEGRWPPFAAPQESYSMREWLSELQSWTIKPARRRN